MTLKKRLCKIKPERELWLLFALVILLQLMLYAWAFILHPESGLNDGGLTRLWLRWDAAHYVRIAEKGYHGDSIDPTLERFISRFPPLYPLAIRMVSSLTGISAFHSGLLISFFATVVASCLLYYLVLFDSNNKITALYSVLFLNLFPTRYFLATSYAEALFIALLAGYLYVIRKRGNFLFAGLLGALLVSTRSAGLLIYPLHFYSAVKYNFHKGERVRTLFSLLLVGLPFISCSLYNKYWLAMPGYLDQQPDQQNQPLQFLSYPFEETITTLARLFTDSNQWTDHSFMSTLGWNHLFLALSVIILVAGMRRLAVEYRIYAVSYIGLLSMFYWAISMARFLLVLLPLFMVLAAIPSHFIRIMLLLGSGTMLFYFSGFFISGG